MMHHVRARRRQAREVGARFLNYFHASPLYVFSSVIFIYCLADYRINYLPVEATASFQAASPEDLIRTTGLHRLCNEIGTREENIEKIMEYQGVISFKK